MPWCVSSSTTRPCGGDSRTRTTNHFGKYPDELEAALKWNRDIAEIYDRLGATIVDASQPLEVVVAEVVTVGQGLLRDRQG